MNLKNKLARAIQRSEKAYLLYIKNKRFFQALRIYKANLKVYALLEEFVFECEEQYLDQVYEYLFHLEDWFESFNAAQIAEPALNDVFVFENLPNSPRFPSNFSEDVLKK